MHNFTANDPIYCYFDIETTGLEPYRNSIIEIAMIIDSKQCAEISQRIPEFDKIDKQFEALIRTGQSTQRCFDDHFRLKFV